MFWSYRTVVRKGERRGEKIERKRGPKHSRISKQLKPSRKRIAKELKRAAKEASKNLNNNDNQNNGDQNSVNKDLERAREDVAAADRRLPSDLQFHIQVRGLEEDEELSRRDLDAEVVFAREYDFLDERDTFDDLD